MEPTIPVFVYGTLKSGMPNHGFLRDATPLGPATTVNHYALHAGAGLPMVDGSNPVSPIHGELYLVNAHTFADLDRLEGHPTFYCRKWVPIRHQGGTIHAWLYFAQQPRGPIEATGNWRGCGA